MRKIRRKICTFLLAMTMLLMAMPALAQDIGITLHATATTGKMTLGVNLNSLPVGIKGLEIHLPIGSKVELQKATWASEILTTDSYVAKVLEDTQTLAIYLASEEAFSKLENKCLVTLELEVAGNLSDISGKEVAIKYIDEDVKEVETSTKVELQINNDEGNKPNDPPNTGGGGGSTPNRPNRPNRPSRPNNDKDKDKPVNVPDNKEENIPVTFTDVTGHWAEDSITKMASRGIITGYEDGTFKPNHTTTRGELAAILCRAFEVAVGEEYAPFSDVETNKWYTPYVSAMYQNGIIKGMSDGTFGVKSFVTNEELAVMMSRILKAKNIVLEVVNPEPKVFKDEAQISSYAIESIKELYKVGILHGTSEGKINPKGLATRAQIAVIIDRILN